jgi:hypothetical protein
MKIQKSPYPLLQRGNLLVIALLVAVAAPAAEKEKEKKSRVMDIEGLVIEGEIQRPEAFFILGRDEKNILSTLMLDPLEDAEKTIEQWSRSELFK